MRARKPGRFLAPLALVAVILVTALVVRAGLNSTTTTHHATTTGPTVVATRRKTTKKRFYVIRPGDTLSTISVKTGIPVAELEALNQNLAANPNALQSGQHLRLH